MQAKNITTQDVRVIAPDEAVQIPFDYKGNLQDLQREMVSLLLEDEIDVAVLSEHGRKKKILIADMDSTMIYQECIDELADYVGKKAYISDITERAMRGELDFEAALQERVRLLEGLSVDDMTECYKTRIIPMAGAKELLDFMREQQAYCGLVSGGFTFFAEKIADRLGFHTYRANELLIMDGKLTGEVKSPILGKLAKKEALQEFAMLNNVTLEDCLAVGDGANDLDMIQASGLGVAYHAKPKVAEAARVAIRFADLKALVYLQM